MAYLFVGADKPYTTIQSAIDAASDGDILIIDQGTYNENLTCSKLISFRGDTDDPISSPVSIYGPTAADPTLDIAVSTAGVTSIYIEGIKFTKADTSWSRVVRTVGDADLKIYINKCYAIAGANQYPIGAGDQAHNTFEVRNCLIDRGYAHFVGINWTNTPNHGIYYTELDNSYTCQSCIGSPSYNDYVTTTTSGYGPLYGDYYLDIPVATCSGITYVNDVATGNIPVRLYRRSTGELVGETTSVSGGLFAVETFYEETHYVVGLYPASGTNALIYDWIDPTYSG